MTTVLEAFADVPGSQCWARLRMSDGDPCWISIAQSGILVKKSKLGLLGARLYDEKGVYQAGRTAAALDILFPEKRTPDGMTSPALVSFTNAVLHCKNLTEVTGVLNEAVGKVWAEH